MRHAHTLILVRHVLTCRLGEAPRRSAPRDVRVNESIVEMIRSASDTSGALDKYFPPNDLGGGERKRTLLGPCPASGWRFVRVPP